MAKATRIHGVKKRQAAGVTVTALGPSDLTHAVAPAAVISALGQLC